MQESPLENNDQRSDEAVGAREHSEEHIATEGGVEVEGKVSDEEEVAEDAEASTEEPVAVEKEDNIDEEVLSTGEIVSFSNVDVTTVERQVSSAQLIYTDASPQEQPGDETGPGHLQERDEESYQEAVEPSESRGAVSREPSLQQVAGPSEQVGPDASEPTEDSLVSSLGSIL